MKSWLRVAIFLTISAFLTRLIPFSEFFRNVDTLIHEMFHALATLILSGDVRYIHLYANQSGVTYMAYADHWMSIPISLAGYFGSALFTVLLFYLHSRKKEKAGLILIAFVAVLGLALFVRNGYGMAWCGGFAALTVAILLLKKPGLLKGYYLLVAFICLVESVISSLIILTLALQDPAAAGDAASLSEVTPIPAIFWGALFAFVSLWCSKISIGIFYKRGFD
ncbi:M50 family metallopeptidase [Cohnella herbarum]|uniref:M50 family metallopeptidase n=1 Tax=Cohnella herbarum TaxID=2728023 RepID=A0A7Z2VQJ1_9BACL|nr:M50 family metallopeptidase [Cohnella herbarum]QJD87257.1 M50 family metallopeptidase [Cohnella herbarum]